MERWATVVVSGTAWCDYRRLQDSEYVKCGPPESFEADTASNRIVDWIPLSVGSVRPTQGRTLAVVQVNGGSQSFNVVNTLRLLGRWMRMFTVRSRLFPSFQCSLAHIAFSPKIPNQSSIPMAWKCFTPSDRLLPSSNRDRLVDVCEELMKTTLILQPHFDLFGSRYSEREEKRQHGKLRTQQETEDAKKKLDEEDEKEQKVATTKEKILFNM